MGRKVKNHNIVDYVDYSDGGTRLWEEPTCRYLDQEHLRNNQCLKYQEQ